MGLGIKGRRMAPRLMQDYAMPIHGPCFKLRTTTGCCSALDWPVAILLALFGEREAEQESDKTGKAFEERSSGTHIH
jgi:hypothetical protein